MAVEVTDVSQVFGSFSPVPCLVPQSTPGTGPVPLSQAPEALALPDRLLKCSTGLISQFPSQQVLGGAGPQPVLLCHF